MNDELHNFGTRLKQQRESRALSIAEIARVTKIPERSLERLEAGDFHSLPGDVFVRGFLRSYARCVGLDPEDTVRGYGQLHGRDERGRKEPIAVAAAAERLERGREDPAEEARPETAAPAARPEGAREDPGILAKALSDVGLGTRRISLTLAVIILVIVATLTLSLLLRRPTHVGSGVSALPTLTGPRG